ncbi:acyl carrier protein [Actinoallomurus spadix]|uniref:Carrier domain-containing protein n=1 Tax=Actinoallomurus spadix TaxID=79912 RepID=A0ABP3H9U4_9ACTN|nr:acyl carrier protein [Actinoallomurus spadix]MCO5988873.1 acyl carrier protein [Actinoallomurus spadix]
MSPTVFAAVRDSLCSALGLDSDTHVITPESELLELPGAASIAMVRALVDIEDRLGVELDDEAIFRVRTVGDVCAVVAGKLKGAGNDG